MNNRFFTVFTAIIVSILVSCGDDDEGSPASITGKWQVSTQETFECPNTADNRVLTCGTYGFCVIIEFKADKTFEMTRSTSGEKMATGTYGMSGSTLYFDYELNPYQYLDPSTLSVTVSGNTMVTVFAPGTTCKTRTTYQKI